MTKRLFGSLVSILEIKKHFVDREEEKRKGVQHWFGLVSTPMLAQAHLSNVDSVNKKNGSELAYFRMELMVLISL